MRYADFRAKGYFIGSGTVESGCKQIITMRLKRPGARWTQHGRSYDCQSPHRLAEWFLASCHPVTPCCLILHILSAPALLHGQGNGFYVA